MTVRRRWNNSSGFTLVEMLAVVLIIAIVVTLAVANRPISPVARTRMNLIIIRGAVNDFRGATGQYPAASADSKTLFTALQGNEKSRAVLATLPDGCIRNGGFMDGFDNYIRYFPDKGVGGGPLLESAGPDLNFANVGDNIRSDD